MNQIEVDFLCLALVLMGMITLLPIGNDWKRLSRSESTSLACWMILYFMIILLWKYSPPLSGVLVGGMAISRMFSLIWMATRLKPKFSLLLVENWLASVGILVLMLTRHH